MTLFNKQILGSYMTARIGKYQANLTEVICESKNDETGIYDLWTMSYVSPKNDHRHFTATMKIYDNRAEFGIINHFTIRGKATKHLYGHPYISFPSFEGEDWNKNCSVLTYKRQAPFNFPVQWQGRAIDSARDGKNTPLIITNKQYETLVLSPLNHLLFGTVSISHLPARIRCGIPRAVHSLPEDTHYKTIMVYGNGVNQTIETWGRLLQTYHHITPIRKNADVHLKYISYWTNAGSTYWYNTRKNTTYEETLNHLKNHHESIGINYGSYQLDSWWYKKEGDNYTSGIVEWEPKVSTRSKNFNSVMPFLQRYKTLPLFNQHKISHVQNLIEKPLGCHFKQLANNSVYVKDQEDDFLIEGFPVPKNKEVAKQIFNKIFDHPKWRLSYVIHDWLQYMNDHHSAFNDFTSGPDYFEALDEVALNLKAADNKCGHLTYQFCMTQPHMTLNTATMQSVTSIRSTSDSDSFFVEGTKRWWWHLYSSVFIQALGKYAFYDNRMTNKSYLHPLSSYSKFEMIWLGLSCGPIGIGDEVGKENTRLLNRVIFKNGEIVKPDRPCLPLDQCYLNNPHKPDSKSGVTVYTHSSVKNYKVYYMLTFNTHPFAREVTMTYRLSEINVNPQEAYIRYNFFTGTTEMITSNNTNTFKMKRRKFYYHIIAPLQDGVALIGDISKHVCASNQIFDRIEITKQKIRLLIHNKHRQNDIKLLLYMESSPEAVYADDKPASAIWKNNKLTIELQYQPFGEMVEVVIDR